MTPTELAQLTRDLPSLEAIDREIARRRGIDLDLSTVTTKQLVEALRARDLVPMKATMTVGARRTGQLFAASPREAAGHDMYGSAERLP